MTEQDNRKSIMERREALRGQESAIYNHINSLISKYQEMLVNDRAPEDERKDLLYQIIDSIKALLDPGSPFSESSFLDDDKKTKLKNLNFFIYGIINGLVNSEQQNIFFRSAGWGDLIGEVFDEDEQTVTGGANIPAAGGGGPPEDPTAQNYNENENDPSSSAWVEGQRKMYKKARVAFEASLEIAGLEKNKLTAAERSKYGPLWTDMSHPYLVDVNLKIIDFPHDQIYVNWKEEWSSIYREVVEEWGLREIKGKTKEDVELMPIEDVVEEAISLELPFWMGDDYAAGENNEYKVALVERIRWGELGWENYDVWTGQVDGKMNDLKDRELSMRLQLFSLQALQLRRKGFAEGDRSKIFENLSKIKLHREQLMLATTCHPRYGEVLTKVFKICQEIPILRGGVLPPNLRAGGRVPQNDRVVLRDGKQVLLHRDLYWEVRDENDESNIVESGYIPAEQQEPGDILLFDYQDEFKYESIGGDNGRTKYKKMISFALQLIKNDPGKFNVREESLPDAEDEEKINFFVQMLYYSFPTASYSLAKRKEGTQTDAHNVDLEEKINWMLVFSPLGQAIHSAHRYGASKVAWLWLLVYYPELAEGHFGAGGETGELNELRKLMILHQECFYDMSDIAGSIPIMPFGDSEFLSVLDMITPSKEERVALKGKAVLKDGTVVEASPDSPKYLKYGGEFDDSAAGSNVTNFDLLETAISGWLSFLQECLKDMSGELEAEDIVGGEGDKKAILGKLMGDFLGKAKMFYSSKPRFKGTDLEGFDHMFGSGKSILWHMVKRVFYAFKYNDPEDRKALFLEAMDAVDHNMKRGGLNSGTAKKMANWLYNRMLGKEGRRWGVESKPSWIGRAMGQSEEGFRGMDIDLGPVSEHDWGGRHENVFNYLKALWEYNRKKSGLRLGDAYGDFPFYLTGEIMHLGPVSWGAQKIKQKNNISRFQAMFNGEIELELPVTRTGLKTGSSSDEKG